MSLSSCEKLSDDELMALCRKGSADAFTALYDRHKQDIINYSARMLRDRELAADVLQETFIYIFRTIRYYQPKSRFKALLFKAAHNITITKLRKIRNLDFIELNENLIPSTPEESLLEKTETIEFFKKNIYTALDKLPEFYREIVLLRYEKDLSYEDMSEILECPVGTVKSRLHNSMESLRQLLKKSVKEELLP
ncbi:MAG: RNA polymerase sigma factor [Planctomycetes bacterium]|nr:RNA polymerase sigma factor [Planctomycetota bacterium]